MKYKLKNGEEIEITETEVIKTVQEEYENKLIEKDKEIKTIKENNEKEKSEIRKEHALQIRAILSGRKETTSKPEFEETEEDEEETALKNAKEYLKKIL